MLDRTFSVGNERETLVLANLAVRRERRGRGIAKALVRACEDVASRWGCETLSLMVDSENTPALRLYRKVGFREIFRDEAATCVLPGDFNLKTAECVNVCMQKRVRGSAGGGGPGRSWGLTNILPGIFGS